MSYFKGEKEFFPGIGQIQFEGRESKNPLAFHYYDEIGRASCRERV